MRNCQKLTYAAVLATLVACSDSADDSLDGGPPSQLLASSELAGAGRIEIYEPIPGELALIYTGPAEIDREMFAELERGTVTPAALYEAISGEAAPPAVAEAEGRALAARARAEADPPADSEIPSVPDRLTYSMPEGDFIRDYCPTNWDYLYCWASRTGYGAAPHLGTSMYTYLNLFRNSAVHQLSYWEDSRWITFVSRVTPQDWLSYIYMFGDRRWRQTEILQADGSGYHASIFGQN